MNAYESWLKGKLEERGWTVIRKGWPDFLCFQGSIERPTDVLAVEAKLPGDEVWRDQTWMKTLLNASGIPTKIIYPQDIGWDQALTDAIDRQYHVLRRRDPRHKTFCRVCKGELREGL